MIGDYARRTLCFKERHMPTSKEPTTTSSSSGVPGELRRLKDNGSASAAELREFVGALRGKSTRELLGEVAKSKLVSSVGVATLAFVVLLAIATVVPYMLRGEPVAAKPAAASPADRNAAATASAAAPTGQKTPGDAASVNDPSQPNIARAAAALGIDETKTAAPDKNPLEDDLDNLLDGAK
jgi:hypothetical protein